MIRHNDVTADTNVKFVDTAKRVLPECLMQDFQAINFSPMQRTDCDEEKRRIIALKNLLEARRASLNHASIVEAAASATRLLGVEAGVSPARFS
jgi:hypothetical protein